MNLYLQIVTGFTTLFSLWLSIIWNKDSNLNIAFKTMFAFLALFNAISFLYNVGLLHV